MIEPPDPSPASNKRGTIRRMVSLLVVACVVSQAAGTLRTPGYGAAPQGINAQRAYVLSAAYPFWRAPTFPPEAIPFEIVHQIDHCFVMPGEHGTLQVPDRFVTPELVELAHRADRKVILGVGGANSREAFASMVADPQDRATFVQNLSDFVLDQGYDGVTVDWEFPQSPADRQNLAAFMAELRAGLDTTDGDLELNIAVSSNEQRGQWVDVEAITPLVRHYVVMTFGYHGAWGSESGHNAPLYPPSLQESQVTPHPLGQGSVDQSLRYWTQTRGVPRSKILMGLPSFGIWFDSEGLYQPFMNSEKADYRDIKPLIDQSQNGNGYTYHWDSTAQVPYLTQDHGPGLWSYDDPRSVGVKCDYVLANELGGIAVWDVTMDLVAGEHELLDVIAHKLTPYRLYLPGLRKG